jgi:hypothetical protein
MSFILVMATFAFGSVEPDLVAHSPPFSSVVACEDAKALFLGDAAFEVQTTVVYTSIRGWRDGDRVTVECKNSALAIATLPPAFPVISE